MNKIASLALLVLISTQALSANSYSWNDLVPPSAHDVFAFSNDKAPATGSRLEKKASEILDYLDKGRVLYSRKALSDFLKEENIHGVEIYDRNFFGYKGVIATNDERIIYWDLMSENVLRLETADLEQCFLLYIDEWSQKALDSLKEYQYSQQAGRKRYTPSDEEIISSYEKAKDQLQARIESETEGLRELYSNYEVATGDEKKAMLREVSTKRAFIEHMEIRLTEMDRKLKPLKLEVEFPTPGHHTIIN
jgi:hypothetical protein